MVHVRISLLTLLTAIGMCFYGCSSKPGPEKSSPPDQQNTANEFVDPEPAPTPAVLVGKWRKESRSKDGGRITVYKFLKDGRQEIEFRTDTPTFKNYTLVKGVITNVDKDKITLVQISRAGEDGDEDVIPPQKREFLVYQFTVEGDELHWLLVANKTTKGPQPRATTPSVFKRVKE